MAEIPGATITFTDYTGAPTDPRLLNVPDAVGDVTVQDVVDTLSAQQAELDALIYDALVDIPDTAGKQTLSATKANGITCTMIRTNVKFADLAGPGWTTKRVLDGNLVAIDGEATRVQIEEMANSAFVNWKTEADVSAALLNPAGMALESSVLANHYMGAVWIDAANGSAGTVPGVNGHPGNPVLGLPDALVLLDHYGYRKIVLVSGTLMLTASLTEFLVEMRDESELLLNGQNVNGTEFRGGVLKGAMTGSITARNVSMEDVSGILGHLTECGMNGTLTLAAGTTTWSHPHSHVPGNDTPTLIFVTGSKANVRNVSGGIKVEGMSDAATVSTIEYGQGQCVIDASCTAGTLVLRGSVKVTDNSGGTTVDTSGTSASLVWAALQALNIGTGTMGELLDDAATQAALAAALSASK